MRTVPQDRAAGPLHHGRLRGRQHNGAVRLEGGLQVLRGPGGVHQGARTQLQQVPGDPGGVHPPEELPGRWRRPDRGTFVAASAKGKAFIGYQFTICDERFIRHVTDRLINNLNNPANAVVVHLYSSTFLLFSCHFLLLHNSSQGNIMLFTSLATGHFTN